MAAALFVPSRLVACAIRASIAGSQNSAAFSFVSPDNVYEGHVNSGRKKSDPDG
jgi:hypothetical protein